MQLVVFAEWSARVHAELPGACIAVMASPRGNVIIRICWPVGKRTRCYVHAITSEYLAKAVEDKQLEYILDHILREAVKGNGPRAVQEW